MVNGVWEGVMSIVEGDWFALTDHVPNLQSYLGPIRSLSRTLHIIALGNVYFTF